MFTFQRLSFLGVFANVDDIFLTAIQAISFIEVHKVYDKIFQK